VPDAPSLHWHAATAPASQAPLASIAPPEPFDAQPIIITTATTALDMPRRSQAMRMGNALYRQAV
jgi:hypothetical protein